VSWFDVDDADEALLRGIELQAPLSGPSARILIAGDICMAHARPVPAEPGSVAPWSGLQQLVDDHDLCLATLECPLTLSDDVILKSGPSLRAHPAWASTVRQGGFDIVSLANNHVRDYGAAGVFETTAACQAAGLQTVGAGEDLTHARQPVTRSVAGLRVGVLAVAENEFGSAGQGRAGGNPFDPLTTPRDVHALRGETDAVLVMLHGGTEGYRLPSPNMTRIARALVEAGASAVVCSHTHVPSGLEIHEEAPIVYGTGNFFFEVPPGDRVGDEWYLGYCVSIWIGRGGVWRIALAPYRQRAGRGVVEPLSEAAASNLMRQTIELSATIGDDEGLAKRWKEFCRMHRARTLGTVLGLSRVERRLVRHGVWPFWRLPRRRLPGLLNLVRCESHRERLITTLEIEHEEVEQEEGSGR
jgi:poly-gamma-glutamate capsule biosynthesis protein CapA/YwtB (metallophosphatase superfamily)